ncbi:MAG: helix-turn-helix domain containing protein, partial [Clostridiaceae bacterium]|nr:helix-turn-helix domain containing protein [Clostridiaceae bacterium]
AKEIRKHRTLKPRNTFYRPILCAKLNTCTKKPCVRKCELYEEPKCNRRDKSPGACNKCNEYNKCHFDKYIYNAEYADKEYRSDLVDYRQGINLTTKECDSIAQIIAPLLKQGQSVHQIISAHPEITQSQRTLYSYIESGVFKEFGVDCFSLKEQVNRKQFKNKYKKRKEPANFEGRRYKDYLAFCLENPETPTVEMDTLYNNPSGPYLQTFQFAKVPFMIGFLHSEKTNESMANRIDWLQDRLGAELFSKLFPLLLTDRGVEFEKHQLFELDKSGNTRLRIFYCDPMQSSQKPHVENNHNYVRDIIPNSYPLDCLTQDDIDLMFSHINSAPRLSLGDKSPFEVFSFIYGEEAVKCLNIRKIERDDVILKPYLIYSK